MKSKENTTGLPTLHAGIVVIGGGPAGLAAALEAKKAGAPSVLVLERDTAAGGILNQCIHNGFGLHYFQEELTGPEYAGRFLHMVRETPGIEIKTDTMVLDVVSLPAGEGEQVRVQAVNPTEGCFQVDAGAAVLAMGCRERTRGAIGIPGTRPAGVYTAGCAQRYINIEGAMPGRRAVILGSGDIGLIMARRLTLEGAQVLACLELMPYSGGLQRNITQCLEDFGIPLYLSHTIIDIRGRGRVEQVVAARVDENRRPIPGTEMVFDCDTVLLSVGLIPENELSRAAGAAIDPRTSGPLVDESMQTSLPGVFACGNVVHVHDLVDFVTMESGRAGRAAARYLARGATDGGTEPPAVPLYNGDNVTYTVPQRVHPGRLEKACEVFFRVNRVMEGAEILVTSGDAVLLRKTRSHLAPGEMERLVLPAALFDRAPEGLRISAHPAEQGEPGE